MRNRPEILDGRAALSHDERRGDWEQATINALRATLPAARDLS